MRELDDGYGDRPDSRYAGDAVHRVDEVAEAHARVGAARDSQADAARDALKLKMLSDPEARQAAFLASQRRAKVAEAEYAVGRDARAAVPQDNPGDDAHRDAPQRSDTPGGRLRPGHPDIRDSYPGDYKLAPDAPPPAIDGPHASPEKWADAINPDKADGGRRFNCGDCSRSVDSTWHGHPAVAAAIDFPRLEGEPLWRMIEWSGVKPERVSMSDVKERLDKLGPGSSAIVGCDWKAGDGHWFNAINDGGTVKAVDGQKGRVEVWPPSLAGLRYDESLMRRSDAIFFTPDGKVVKDDH